MNQTGKSLSAILTKCVKLGIGFGKFVKLGIGFLWGVYGSWVYGVSVELHSVSDVFSMTPTQ